MQQRTYGMAIGGVRFRIVALGLALVGVAFVAVGVWVFLLPAVADIHAGRVVIFTATRVGITWSQVYSVRDHPFDFSVGVLTKILGGLGFGNMGLLVSFGCLLRALGPADMNFGSSGRRAMAIWAYTSIAAIVLYFVLWLFPYLLRFGVLS